MFLRRNLRIESTAHVAPAKQRDTKGQIVTLAYDTLGRLLSRSEPEGTTNWTYDEQAEGSGMIRGHR